MSVVDHRTILNPHESTQINPLTNPIIVLLTPLLSPGYRKITLHPNNEPLYPLYPHKTLYCIQIKPHFISIDSQKIK